MTDAKQLRLDCPKTMCTGTIVVDPSRIGTAIKCPKCGTTARVSKSQGQRHNATGSKSVPHGQGCERIWYLSSDALVQELTESDLQRRLKEGSIEPDVLLSRDEENWRPVHEYVRGYVHRSEIDSPRMAVRPPEVDTGEVATRASPHEAIPVIDEQQEALDFLGSISSPAVADSSPRRVENAHAPGMKSSAPATASSNANRRRGIPVPVAWLIAAAAGLVIAAIIGTTFGLSTQITSVLWCAIGATIYQSLRGS